jgi:hypothetical protein
MTIHQLSEQDGPPLRLSSWTAGFFGSSRRTRRRALATAVALALPVAVSGCAGASAARSPVSAAVGPASPPHASTTTSTTLAKAKPKHRRNPGSGGATVGYQDTPPPPLPGQLTFVGDSVGVDTAPFIQQYIPNAKVYAAVDRSWGQGEAILQGLANQGELGSVVVVELGLNGPITDSDFLSMMAILAHVPRVVFVNIRLPAGAYGPGTDWWQDQNNAVLAGEIPHFHNAYLANWYAYSAGHPSWFAPDGIHLEPSGGAAMAQLVKQYA